MKLLAPSILSADFTNLGGNIRSTAIGGADWIHCDIMDGHFVPNITFGPMVVKAVNGATDLPIDSHLMIENPDNYIEEFAKAGSDYITVHQETCPHLHRTIQFIRSFGVKAGVSINPATPVSLLYDILEDVDLVLVMSVNPGFGGQKFIKNSLTKVRELVELRERLDFNYLIEVDGGVNQETINEVSDAGCDVFVAGSAVFGKGNITEATTKLKNMLLK